MPNKNGTEFNFIQKSRNEMQQLPVGVHFGEKFPFKTIYVHIFYKDITAKKFGVRNVFKVSSL